MIPVGVRIVNLRENFKPLICSYAEKLQEASEIAFGTSGHLFGYVRGAPTEYPWGWDLDFGLGLDQDELDLDGALPTEHCSSIGLPSETYGKETLVQRPIIKVSRYQRPWVI
jgi:hypothetical protein